MKRFPYPSRSRPPGGSIRSTQDNQSWNYTPGIRNVYNGPCIAATEDLEGVDPIEMVNAHREIENMILGAYGISRS